MATTYENADVRIVRKKGGGVVTAWTERHSGIVEIYIRESLDRGKDVQTIALTGAELRRILTLDYVPVVEKENAG